MPPAARGSAIVLVLALFFPGTLEAQSVTRTDGGGVAVEARGVALERLLTELTAVMPIAADVDAAAAGRPVSVTLETAHPLGALRQVLIAAGVDFLIGLDAAGGVRVHVAAPRDPAGPVQPAAPAPVAASANDQPPGEPPPAEPGGPVESTALEPDAGLPPIYPAELSTPEHLLRLLSPRVPPRAPRQGLIPLPFPGADGNQLYLRNDAPPGEYIALPFPDEHGGQLRIPRPRAAPRAGAPAAGPEGSPAAADPRHP